MLTYNYFYWVRFKAGTACFICCPINNLPNKIGLNFQIFHFLFTFLFYQDRTDPALQDFYQFTPAVSGQELTELYYSLY